MKEDDFKSGDRREGGRPAYGRRDDARSGNNDARPRMNTDRRDDNAGSRPFNRDQARQNAARPDAARPNRADGATPRNSDDRPRRDFGSRDENAGSRPFNRDSRRDDNRPTNGSTDRPRYNSDDRNRPASDNRRFDRDATNSDRRSDSPRRDDNRTGSASRFGNKPERREEYPRPKFNRDNNRSDERPRYNDRPAPRFDRDAPTRQFDNDRPERNDRSEPRTEQPRSDRPARSTDDIRQRSGEDRFGQERKYEERRTAAPRENTDRPYNRDDRSQNTERPTSPRRNDDRRDDARPRSFDRDAPRRFDNDRNTSSDRPKPRFDNDRPTGSRNSSPAPRFPRQDNQSGPRRSGPSSEERRVGKYDRAPRYDQETMRNSIPQRKREELERAEKRDDGTIRLNRYIANAGICSRREADELIARGDVQVNGKVVTEMGHKVQPGDVVKYGNRILNPEKMVYVLLNKPKDYITTTDDPEERRTVMELVADAGPFRIYPVGRLDRNTTGLMLMTNDGELAEKLTHPSNEIKKVYQVELDKPISDEHFEAIQRGVELEDGLIKPDALSIVTPDAQVVGIEIHSGRNRIVRRIFENFGYEVTKLDRTSYAGLTKKELPRGNWRFLEPKEVIKLKYLQ